MNDIFILRPLIWAIIEYGLVLFIFFKGKGLNRFFLATLAFFIASYQLGEFFILIDSPESIGERIAFFSTTLLPPLGVLALEGKYRRHFGGLALLIFFLSLALYYVYNPNVISHVDDCYCVLKYRASIKDSTFVRVWSAAYITTLSYAVIILIYFTIKDYKNKLLRFHDDIKMLVAYLAFFPTGLMLTLIFGWYGFEISLICTLAIITVFILAHISLKPDDEGFRWKMKNWW